MSEVVVARQFCGPPNSGNGGYVSGLLAQSIPGPATAVLRAIIPLNTPLNLTPGQAALDCPGSIAWVELKGQGGGLLGTMTAEILRRPAANEPVIITAWPLEQDGRKQFAGVAMFSVDGELMARAHQVWITMKPRVSA